jgi:hypothetical protein
MIRSLKSRSENDCKSNMLRVIVEQKRSFGLEVVAEALGQMIGEQHEKDRQTLRHAEQKLPIGKQSGMQQHWLIIERPENWEADYRNGFSSFGLPHRYKNVASEIKDRDKVYCYVSRIGAFADIRVVLDAGIKQMKEDSFHDIYSRNFAYYFTTTPLIVLPRDKWLPLSRLTSRLELTRDRTASSIRAVFQRSIRKLSRVDAELLTHAMEGVAEQEG